MDDKQNAEPSTADIIGKVDPAKAEPFGYAAGYRDAINDQLRARISMEYASAVDWPVMIVSLVLAVIVFRLIYATD
jgi:hypothetical protein